MTNLKNNNLKHYNKTKKHKYNRGLNRGGNKDINEKHKVEKVKRGQKDRRRGLKLKRINKTKKKMSGVKKGGGDLISSENWRDRMLKSMKLVDENETSLDDVANIEPFPKPDCTIM